MRKELVEYIFYHYKVMMVKYFLQEWLMTLGPPSVNTLSASFRDKYVELIKKIVRTKSAVVLTQLIGIWWIFLLSYSDLSVGYLPCPVVVSIWVARLHLRCFARSQSLHSSHYCPLAPWQLFYNQQLFLQLCRWPWWWS